MIDQCGSHIQKATSKGEVQSDRETAMPEQIRDGYIKNKEANNAEVCGGGVYKIQKQVNTGRKGH